MSKDPTDILIVGAPTSGKTDAAQSFAKLCNSAIIVDSPVDTLLALDYEVGRRASYLSTMAMSIMQFNNERIARKETNYEYVVTVGGLLQRMAHIGAFLEHNGPRMKRLALSDLEREDIATNFTGRALGFMLVDTFVYKHVFYLPMPKLDEIWPDDLSEEEKHNQRVDVGIRQALENFFIPFTMLDRDEDIAQQMMRKIEDSRSTSQPQLGSSNGE